VQEKVAEDRRARKAKQAEQLTNGSNDKSTEPAEAKSLEEKTEASDMNVSS